MILPPKCADLDPFEKMELVITIIINYISKNLTVRNYYQERYAIPVDINTLIIFMV